MLTINMVLTKYHMERCMETTDCITPVVHVDIHVDRLHTLPPHIHTGTTGDGHDANTRRCSANATHGHAVWYDASGPLWHAGPTRYAARHGTPRDGTPWHDANATRHDLHATRHGPTRYDAHATWYGTPAWHDAHATWHAAAWDGRARHGTPRDATTGDGRARHGTPWHGPTKHDDDATGHADAHAAGDGDPSRDDAHQDRWRHDHGPGQWCTRPHGHGPTATTNGTHGDATTSWVSSTAVHGHGVLLGW